MHLRHRSSLLVLLALVAGMLALPVPAAVAADRLTVVVAPTTGRPVFGEPLTITPAVWSTEPDTVTYTWFRDQGDDPVLLDASGPTYVPTGDDLGQPLRVEITAEKEGYDDGWDVLVTQSVLPATFSADPGVTVVGEPRVGEPMTATVSAPPSPTPDRYSFAWYIQDPGATPSDPDVVELLPGSSGFVQTLVPGPELVGRRLVVQVMAHRDFHDSVETTTMVGFVAPGHLAPPRVAVRGIARVGSVLTASASASVPAGSMAFQWLRGTTPITGAVARTYRPTSADLGRALHVRATATAPGYVPTAASSAAVTIGPGPARLRVVVPGRVRVGSRVPVKVTGLVAGERFVVALAGRRTAGTANRAGVGSVRVRVVGNPGVRSVSVVASYADRRGSATLRVRR